MAVCVKSQPDFLEQLLTLASRPATKLDGLLQCILEKALALTASDVGGCLCLYETSGQKPVLIRSVLRGHQIGTSPNLLKQWKDTPCCADLVVTQSGRPYCIEDHQTDPAHLPFLPEARSSLLVPLLEDRKVMGVIHLESSQAGHYDRDHLRQLQGLAAEVVSAINRVLLREEMARMGAPNEIVGISDGLAELERDIKRAAAYSKGPVLIIGERGSGKELTAWAIHCWSDRRDKPFVPVLASAFAESLFADELFGHERYAFTDAARERPGKFKAADGGTLFFDEIGDMSMTVQSALLRIIERGELPRIGRDMPLRVDVRVMAATNQEPDRLIAEGRLREDLYDRLSVYEIRVPPLRERREGIPVLASHFLRKYCTEMRRSLTVGAERLCQVCQNAELASCATADFYRALQDYDWPGNVRELEHVILRLLARVPDERLDVKHLQPPIWKATASAPGPKMEDLTLETAIKNHIERVLHMTNENRSRAADILGIPLSTLRSKIKKLAIETKDA